MVSLLVSRPEAASAGRVVAQWNDPAVELPDGNSRRAIRGTRRSVPSFLGCLRARDREWTWHLESASVELAIFRLGRAWDGMLRLVYVLFRPCASDLLPSYAAHLCVWRRRLQDQGQLAPPPLLSSPSAWTDSSRRVSLYPQVWNYKTRKCLFTLNGRESAVLAPSAGALGSDADLRSGLPRVGDAQISTMSEPSSSTTSTRGSSLPRTTRRSGSGTGRAETASRSSPATTTTSCAPSSTQRRTSSSPPRWT
jgi:hypothetical protein